MTQHEPIIDVENPSILSESEWIGTGKSYPTSPEKVPEALRNYRSLHLEIPRDAAHNSFEHIHEKRRQRDDSRLGK